MRILPAENLRFSGEGSSAQSKPGPKPRRKSVGDGESVENPMPLLSRLKDGVTQEGKLSVRMEKHVQGCRVKGRQNRLSKKPEDLRGAKTSSEAAEPKLSRKTPNEAYKCPYRKPTQVGGVRILRRAREPSLRNSAK